MVGSDLRPHSHMQSLGHSLRVKVLLLEICGSVALWFCGSVDLWMSGSVDLWICRSVDLEFYGSVDIW